MTQRIKRSKIKKKPSQKIITKTPPQEYLVFSFKYLNLNNKKFLIKECPPNYLQKFLERIKPLSNLKVCEFINNCSKTYRNHPIKWQDTTELKGFKTIKFELWENCAYQFSISSKKYGRIFGFINHNIFYIVWIDPKHKLYKSQ